MMYSPGPGVMSGLGGLLGGGGSPSGGFDFQSTTTSEAPAVVGDNGAVKFGNYLFSDSVSGSGVTAKNMALLVGVGLLSWYVIKKVK